MFRSINELKGRKVALFGLSANPPTGHCGHLGIVRFLVQTDLFDEVWVMPVYQHMFAAKRSMEPFEHRVAMCRLCMEDESTPKCHVRVVEIEKYAADYYAKKEGPDFRVGTVNVLDYIFEMVPGIVLQLVLGTDTYKDLIARKWKQADRILHMVTVHAISRLGIETTGVEISTDRCLISIDTLKKGGENGEREDVNVKIVHHKVPWLTEVSSSLIRRISTSVGIDLSCLVNKKESEELSRSEGDAAMKDLLDERVLSYIKKHRLFGYGNAHLQVLADSSQGDAGATKRSLEDSSIATIESTDTDLTKKNAESHKIVASSDKSGITLEETQVSSGNEEVNIGVAGKRVRVSVYD